MILGRDAIKALKVAKRAILEEPRRLDMEHWGLKVTKKVSPCNTTGCVAGWLVIKHDHISLANTSKAIIAFNVAMGAAADRATEILNVSEAAANRLFYVNEWPYPFKNDYVDASETLKGLPLQKKLAQITGKRIDFFIKTDSTDDQTIGFE